MMKISIIVSSYNIENYIKKCLDTIINQTLRDIEIIIVDDASTDSTQDIIREVAKTDDRIKTVFFNQNTIGGVGSAANAGIEIAQGEYIGFADGDDWYELDMFERLYVNAIENNADVSFCNFLIWDEILKTEEQPSDAQKWDLAGRDRIRVTSRSMRKKYLGFNPVPWRKIYKKKFIDKYSIRFPVGDHFFEDNPFHWEAVLLADGIVADNFIGCYHRVKRKGQTMASEGKELLGMYKHHLTIRKFLKKHDELSGYDYEVVRWLIGNTLWISKRIKAKFLPELFFLLRTELSIYDYQYILNMVNSNAFGIFGCDLVRSVITNNCDLFIVTAQPGEYPVASHQQRNIIYKIYTIYKHHGLKTLFKKAQIYTVHTLGIWCRNISRLFVTNSMNYRLNQQIIKQNNVIHRQNLQIIEQNKKILSELEFNRIAKLFSIKNNSSDQHLSGK
ncbi:MAG: glycosyltransferase family 2 protein [Bacteroidetes bacterium]|nr:glycosyltransferase family 2 protein [Bacteroidota bacterium]